MLEPSEDQISVLLVDDDEEDYLLTKDLLAQFDSVRHDLHWVADYQSALQTSRAGLFDVCLIDYRLGAEDGIQLVRELLAGGSDMPVIVLTGQGDHEVDMEAARAGAADYLVKGEMSAALLERTIRYAIRSHADMRALRDSEAMLRQTQRLEAVGQMAGGVAHDFNNILTAVVGFSELALSRVEAEGPLRAYIEEIQRAGERASTMTHQLLAFSRRQVLQTRVLDLNAIVSDLESLLRRLIADNVQLISSLDQSIGSVQADHGQLEQVIVNLAINASDAMPSGGTLRIQTASVELDENYASRHIDVQPGAYVQLRVTDTGSGMDEETLRHIFEPFFTTKQVGKGTGLGLSTVFGIVKQSGGDIDVHSEPDIGTTFDIYLPQLHAPVDTPPATSTTPKLPRGTETVLLVDDEELVRSFEREVLSAQGYVVLEAQSPSEALELSRGHAQPIDLLLTDVVMPQLSGRELADRLCQNRPGLRVLYTSGYASDAIAHHGILESGIAFLPKPLDRASLAHKVRDVLDA